MMSSRSVMRILFALAVLLKCVVPATATPGEHTLTTSTTAALVSPSPMTQVCASESSLRVTGPVAVSGIYARKNQLRNSKPEWSRGDGPGVYYEPFYNAWVLYTSSRPSGGWYSLFTTTYGNVWDGAYGWSSYGGSNVTGLQVLSCSNATAAASNSSSYSSACPGSWHYGSNGQSCSSVCAAAAGTCDLTGIQSISSNMVRFREIATRLGAWSACATWGTSGGWDVFPGTLDWTSGVLCYRNDSWKPTTCAGSHSKARRVCRCCNPSTSASPSAVTTTTSTSASPSAVTTTTAIVTPIDLKGWLTVSVISADSFLNETTVQDAVKEGLALAFSTAQHTVLASHVKLEFTKMNRRLAARQRLLAGNVMIAYTITLPADSGIQAAALQVAQGSTAAQLAVLTVAIQQKVAAVKGSGYEITVTSMEDPVVQSSVGAVLATAPPSTSRRCESFECMGVRGVSSAKTNVLPHFATFVSFVFAFASRMSSI